MEAENQPTIDIEDLIREKHALVGKGDYYGILGIESDAEVTEIRDAYFQLAKLFHPDAIARTETGELEKEALEVFKEISEAYRVLGDKKRRILYQQEGAEAVSARQPAAAKSRDKISEARIFFHKGTMFLQRRAYTEAARCFYKSVELDPSRGRYMCHLGHAILLNMDIPKDRRLREAKEWFEKAVETSQNDHEPYYFRSLYHKAVGEVDRQRADLQDALTINSNHVESKREARLLAMRSRRTPSSGIYDMVNQVKAALAKLTKKK